MRASAGERRPKKSYHFKHVRFNEVHVKANYKGPPINISSYVVRSCCARAAGGQPQHHHRDQPVRKPLTSRPALEPNSRASGGAGARLP